MSSGLPHLPDPHEHESVVERRCAGCGCWNDAAEARCQRCGRKLETSLGAEGRRELEETETLPGPSIPVAVEPKPAPEPEWKEELQRRLAGYRERKAAFDETADLERPDLPEKHLPLLAKLDEEPLPPARKEDISPLPPPRRERSESNRLEPTHSDLRREREHEPIRRLAEPPIVDRLLVHPPTGPAPSAPVRPPVEELQAPIRYRFIAGLLDVCVVALALGVFLAVMHLLNPAVLKGPNRWAVAGGGFIGLLVIYWVAYLRLLGSTAGMIWTGLHVVNLDGEPPDTQQRWTRALGTVLSAAALGMGFLWSLFDEQHFTWHDRVSKTFVSVNN
ncbi:MAG: RDD family protein [Bryobacterales bacterium]|nr:RDD family protein [Bryobacterales bacterium]